VQRDENLALRVADLVRGTLRKEKGVVVDVPFV